MTEEYKPGPQGSATYDHLSGKITDIEYRAYLDRQREVYGLPPIDRTPGAVVEETLEIGNEGASVFDTDLNVLDSEAIIAKDDK